MFIIWRYWKRYLLDRGEMQCKRISKSAMAQSTYCTQSIKHKFEIRNASWNTWELFVANECCFDAIFPPAQSTCNFDTSADRNVGKSRLCDRSRSSAIIWKQLSLQSAICNPWSSAIIKKPAFIKILASLLMLKYLKTEFNFSFMMDSRWCKLSHLKTIFVSSANIRKDSFFEQLGKSLI